MMRYVAKNIVAAGLAKKCEIQVAYAIGKAEPMGIMVDTWRTNAIPEDKISDLGWKYFDLTPRGIIDKLNLRRPIYKQTAAYGHFGRTDLDVPWEETDMADILKKEAGL
jgi:S-adenosylmethionine synthetase